MTSETITLPLFRCLRCQHSWWPIRDPSIVPKRCPSCQSYSWDRNRVRKSRAEMLSAHREKISEDSVDADIS